jgi:oxygen-independent coproporphyrinogen-3 oxidase
VHNSLYWHGGEWLGLGNGAHSFWKSPSAGEGGEGGERWANPRSVPRYLAGAPAEVTRLDAVELQSDLVWTALRTRDGVSRALVERRPGLDRLRAAGLVEDHGDRVRPTPRGLLFADEIAATLL